MSHNIELSQPAQSLIVWAGGPLPNVHLERAAYLIFQREYPERLWFDPLMKPQQDDARRFALMILRPEYIAANAWTLADCVDNLTDQACQLTYGDRRIGSTIRNQMRDVCESFFEDLALLFPKKLFYPRDVAANEREVAREEEVC